MNRLRLADVRTPIARVANECTTSTRVRELANESHRRLVPKGRWLGTVQNYQICVSGTGCFAWPRQIDTIEAYWICDVPGTIRSEWYEASINGPGLLDSDDGHSYALIDRGTRATFDDIDNTVSKVMVYSSTAEAAGKRILIRGYDENSNWIRTQDGGSWIDGEYVEVTNANRYTVNKFTAITEVIKDVTVGVVRLWQYDTTLATATKQLAYYEPDETLPIYRASLIPGLQNRNGCASNTSDCSNTKITVRAKLRHIDVVQENDFFLIGNLAAIKLMAMAILKEERNLPDEAIIYEAKALKELQDELGSYEGDGHVPIIKTESPMTWGAGGVINTVTLGARVYY